MKQEIKSKDRVTQRAIELAQKEGKKVLGMHVLDWIKYLERAEMLLIQERIYDNYQNTYGK